MSETRSAWRIEQVHSWHVFPEEIVQFYELFRRSYHESYTKDSTPIVDGELEAWFEPDSEDSVLVVGFANAMPPNARKARP